MGTPLTGHTPGTTYPGLIKTGDSAPIDGALRTLSDGNGNDLAMRVSTGAIELTQPQFYIGGETITALEVSYLSGLTGNIQDQIDAIGGGLLSTLGAAAANNTINNAAYLIEWDWNSATTQSAFTLTANALTTGNLLSLSSTSGASTSAAVLNVAKTGAGTTNTAIKASASGGTNNYAALLTGFVGIGTSAPQNYLDVVKGTAGTMGKSTYEIASFEYNADAKFGIYTSSASASDGASLLFGQTTLTAASAYPGFEIQYKYSATEGSNFLKYNFIGRDATGTVTRAGVDILDIYANGTIAINGATGISTTVNPKLGVGVSAPAALIHGLATTEQLRLGYDADYYFKATVAANANVTFDLVATAGTPAFTFNKNVTIVNTLSLGVTTASQGSIILYGGTSGSVTLSTAAAAGTGTVFQLPVNNGTNGYYLTTNGSGVTSWAAVSGGSSSLNGITAATAANTPIDNLNYAQEWDWSTITTQTAFKYNANGNTLTTGTVLALVTASTALTTGNLLTATLTGANTASATTTQTATFSNTRTGTTSTNIGITVTASGATNNYSAILTGYLGLYTSTPASKFQLNHDANSVTQSDANGIFLANATAAISGTQSISPPFILQGRYYETTGATSRIIQFRDDVLPVQGTSGSGVIHGYRQTAASTAGGAYNILYTLDDVGGNVFNMNRASSGNSSIFRMNCTDQYGVAGNHQVSGNSGSEVVLTLNGTSGQTLLLSSSTSESVIKLNGSGTLLSIGGGSTGNVQLFTGSTTNMVYLKNSNGRLGFFTNAPAAIVDAWIGSDAFRITNSSGNYVAFSVGATGSTTIAATGSGAALTFTNQSTFTNGVISSAAIRFKTYTVATLPASPTTNDTVAVSDALAPAWGTAVTGGGAVQVQVMWNGSNWICT